MGYVLKDGKLMVTLWTPEECDQLRKRWDDGDAIVDIARALGKTTSTICGKARRMGLHKRRLAANGFERRPAAKHPWKNAPPEDALPRRVKVSLVPLPAWERAAPGAPGILDLRHGDCRWPLDHALGTRFCCAPALDGRPYCLPHAVRAMKTGRPTT